MKRSTRINMCAATIMTITLVVFTVIILDANHTSEAIGSTTYDDDFAAQQNEASGGKCNLTPYKPSDWSQKIVVSNATGTTKDSSPLYSNDTLYVDWAVLNNGNANAVGPFAVTLYIDGRMKYTWEGWGTPPGLKPHWYIWVKDYGIGSLRAGEHTLRIVADSTRRVPESNESDNAYKRKITVLESQCVYDISPTSQSFASTGGEGSVNVSTSNYCTWTANSNINWITITSKAGGTGCGTVNYKISTNSSSSSRTGTLTVAGKTFTVQQYGANGSYTGHWKGEQGSYGWGCDALIFNGLFYLDIIIQENGSFSGTWDSYIYAPYLDMCYLINNGNAGPVSGNINSSTDAGTISIGGVGTSTITVSMDGDNFMYMGLNPALNDGTMQAARLWRQ